MRVAKTAQQLRSEVASAASETEDKKLEKIYEDMKDVTDKLRSQLEAKTAELAPVQEELSVFQAALDTATTESSLLEDATSRSKEQLDAAEKELANLDTFQSDKRAELAEATKVSKVALCFGACPLLFPF